MQTENSWGARSVQHRPWCQWPLLEPANHSVVACLQTAEFISSVPLLLVNQLGISSFVQQWMLVGSSMLVEMVTMVKHLYLEKDWRSGALDFLKAFNMIGPWWPFDYLLVGGNCTLSLSLKSQLMQNSIVGLLLEIGPKQQLVFSSLELVSSWKN